MVSYEEWENPAENIRNGLTIVYKAQWLSSMDLTPVKTPIEDALSGKSVSPVIGYPKKN